MLRWIVPLLCFSVLFFSAPARATDLWIVLIDVERYDDPAIDGAMLVEGRINAIEEAFRALPTDANLYESKHLRRLSSTRQGAGMDERPRMKPIRALFETPDDGLLSRVETGDSVLVFIGGRRGSCGGQDFFLPMDARFEDCSGSAIPWAQFQQWKIQMEARGAQVDLFFFGEQETLVMAKQGATSASRDQAQSKPTPEARQSNEYSLKPGEMAGWIVFNSPPEGKSTIHRIAIQGKDKSQTYFQWGKEITDQFPADLSLSPGYLVAVTPAGGPLSGSDQFSINSPQSIRNLKSSPDRVWPTRIGVEEIDESALNSVHWTEGQVTDIVTSTAPAIPHRVTLNGPNGGTLEVVLWPQTADALLQMGKELPTSGKVIRIGGLIQDYRGTIQLRFVHPEHYAVVK